MARFRVFGSHIEHAIYFSHGVWQEVTANAQFEERSIDNPSDFRVSLQRFIKPRDAKHPRRVAFLI